MRNNRELKEKLLQLGLDARDAGLLGVFVRHLRQFDAALLRQLGDRHADELAVGRRVEAEVGGLDGLADFAERALYNHILASQEPKQGMFTYFMSLKPGHFKTYSTPHDSFWCCVGSGMDEGLRIAQSGLDGSSLFGADERWQNYYRFSAAW